MTFRIRYSSPTASARIVANGPPTGAENRCRTADPGFSTTMFMSTTMFISEVEIPFVQQRASSASTDKRPITLLDSTPLDAEGH